MIRPNAIGRPRDEQSLSEKVFRGAVWMVLMRGADKLLGVVSMIVLARLLTPSDFGLAAMAMSVVAFVELLGAFNFDMALIQNQRTDRSDLDSVWSLNMMLGLACGVGILFSAPLAVALYSESKLLLPVSALAVASIVGGVENIGVIAYRKELDFRREFVFLFSKRLLVFTVTLVLAFSLHSYWALIVGTIVGRAAGTLLSYAIHPFRPRFDLSAAGRVLRFSAWLLVNNLLYFVVHRSSDFIVGRALGSTALGVHAVSYEVANLPTTHMIAPINRVVYPAYSKVADRKVALADAFLRVFGLIALAALPAGLGIAAISDLLVEVALGARWRQAGTLIGILAVAGAIGAIQTNVGYVYSALGRPRKQTVLVVFYVACLVPLMMLGVTLDGLRGVALAFLATSLLSTPVTFAMLARDLNLRLIELIRPTFRPLISAGLMYVAIRGAELGLHLEYSIGLLLGAVAFGCGIYVASVWIMWAIFGRSAGPEREVVDHIQKAWTRWRQRAIHVL